MRGGPGLRLRDAAGDRAARRRRPERYAGAPMIVAGDRYVRETVRKSEEKTKTKAKALSERRWIPASLAGELGRIPGSGGWSPR
nr:hypothetical protein GCM10020093_068660 [Planobispora longispora]